MSDYLFYPGCSMESSAKAYQASLDAICKPLGINLHEIEDWNCCGATEYLSLDLSAGLLAHRPQPGPGRTAIQWHQNSHGCLQRLLS